MTKGEYRISDGGIGVMIVERIKDRAADLIDVIEDIHVGMPDTAIRGQCPTKYDEVSRLKALAQTAIEEGAMWAVKAATKGEPDG